MSRLSRAWRELTRTDEDASAVPLSLFSFGQPTYRIERPLERIALALEHLDRKTVKRRPRIIECYHSELHPEAEIAS